MSSDRLVYIQNTHNAPITCNARGKNGEVTLTKKFMPALTEKFSGKMLHSGYERLTEDEYNALVETSRTFQVYSGNTGKAKLLVVHDDLPADAKTPHEALVDARKDAKKAAAKIAELEGQIVALKAQILDEQTKYKALSSASTDNEKLKPLNDKIAELEAKNAELEKVFDELGSSEEEKLKPLNDKIVKLEKALGELRPPEDKTVELTASNEKLLQLVETHAKALGTLAAKIKDKNIQAAVDVFIQQMDALKSGEKKE